MWQPAQSSPSTAASALGRCISVRRAEAALRSEIWAHNEAEAVPKQDVEINQSVAHTRKTAEDITVLVRGKLAVDLGGSVSAALPSFHDGRNAAPALPQPGKKPAGHDPPAPSTARQASSMDWHYMAIDSWALSSFEHLMYTAPSAASHRQFSLAASLSLPIAFHHATAHPVRIFHPVAD
jgi:hypothetical protein